MPRSSLDLLWPAQCLRINGASAIHSAEERLAPATVALWVKDFPVISFLMVTVNSEPW
jgi:hypothetical protein